MGQAASLTVEQANRVDSILLRLSEFDKEIRAADDRRKLILRDERRRMIEDLVRGQ